METTISTGDTPQPPPLGLPGPQERQEHQGHQEVHERPGALDPPGVHEHHGPHGRQAVQGNPGNLERHGPHDPHGAPDSPGVHDPHGHPELSVPEAAVSTGLSISTIRRLINGGKLPARYERGEKGQHKYFIRRADLATLAELGKGTARAEGSGARRVPAQRVMGSGHRDQGPGVRGQEDGPFLTPHPWPLTPGAPRQGVPEDHAPGAHGAPGDPPGPMDGDHGLHTADAPGAHGVHTAEPHGDHGSLEACAAQFELAVLRERLDGAQEAVRLHAERVRAQAKDIGFLQSQLDQSRRAEEQLRVLLGRLTAALPAPHEPPALAAKNVTPRAGKIRWWPFGRRGG